MPERKFATVPMILPPMPILYLGSFGFLVIERLSSRLIGPRAAGISSLGSPVAGILRLGGVTGASRGAGLGIFDLIVVSIGTIPEEFSADCGPACPFPIELPFQKAIAMLLHSQDLKLFSNFRIFQCYYARPLCPF